MDNDKLNLLVSYPYITKSFIRFFKENEHRVRLLIDSGAFTAWKSGKEINIEQYCEFIQSLPITPWKYFSLDVIGSQNKTLINYEIMLKKGLSPIPVFTRGSNIEVLETYYKTSDVVGIGGLVGTKNNCGFVKGIMKVIGNRKVHLLGFARLPFLKKYRPYMCDSSSWEMGARFASIPIYLGKGRSLVSLKKELIKEQLNNKLIVEALTNYGFNPNDLLKKENWNGGHSISRRIGAKAMKAFSLDIWKHLGTYLFLAASTENAAKILLEEPK